MERERARPSLTPTSLNLERRTSVQDAGAAAARTRDRTSSFRCVPHLESAGQRNRLGRRHTAASVPGLCRCQHGAESLYRSLNGVWRAGMQDATFSRKWVSNFRGRANMQLRWYPCIMNFFFHFRFYFLVFFLLFSFFFPFLLISPPPVRAWSWMACRHGCKSGWESSGLGTACRSPLLESPPEPSAVGRRHRRPDLSASASASASARFQLHSTWASAAAQRGAGV